MEAASVLVRTGSGSMSMHPLENDPSVYSPFSTRINSNSNSNSVFISAPRSVHFDRKPLDHPPPLRRSRSDVGAIRSLRWSTDPRTTDEESSPFLPTDAAGSKGRVVLSVGNSDPAKKGAATASEVEYFSGGGAGRGVKIGGGGRGGDGGGGGMEAYYKEMLRVDPENSLLLRNYGKFLHEVEGDVEGAEECYGRAILASPGDGEVLSLYGKLMWEAHNDEERADAYYQRAVQASPDDSFVMGSYAHFLWDAEEEEEEEKNKNSPTSSSSSAAANGVMVEAF